MCPASFTPPSPSFLVLVLVFVLVLPFLLQFLRALTPEEATFIAKSAENYAELAAVHLTENAKSFEEIEAEVSARHEREGVDEAYHAELGIKPATGAVAVAH